MNIAVGGRLIKVALAAPAGWNDNPRPRLVHLYVSHGHRVAIPVTAPEWGRPPSGRVA